MFLKTVPMTALKFLLSRLGDAFKDFLEDGKMRRFYPFISDDKETLQKYNSH